MDTLSLNMLRITTDTGILLPHLLAPLDTTNMPLCLFVTLTIVVALILQRFKAVMDSAAWVPNRYTIYHHNPYLLSLVYPCTLIASMV
jgi:hypothetical protein